MSYEVKLDMRTNTAKVVKYQDEGFKRTRIGTVGTIDSYGRFVPNPGTAFDTDSLRLIAEAIDDAITLNSEED